MITTASLVKKSHHQRSDKQYRLEYLDILKISTNVCITVEFKIINLLNVDER